LVPAKRHGACHKPNTHTTIDNDDDDDGGGGGDDT
jgi:hypothetical protein